MTSVPYCIIVLNSQEARIYVFPGYIGHTKMLHRFFSFTDQEPRVFCNTRQLLLQK